MCCFRNISVMEETMTTNFELITKSPEKLAEFIDNVTTCCATIGGSCYGCLLENCCMIGEIEAFLDWLNEECNE